MDTIFYSFIYYLVNFYKGVSVKKMAYSSFVFLFICFIFIHINIDCGKHSRYFRASNQRKMYRRMPNKRVVSTRANKGFSQKRIRQQRASCVANDCSRMLRVIQKKIKRFMKCSVKRKPVSEHEVSSLQIVPHVSDAMQRSFFIRVITIFLHLLAFARAKNATNMEEKKSYHIGFNHCFQLNGQQVFAKMYDEQEASYQCSFAASDNVTLEGEDVSLFCNFYPTGYALPGEPCVITVDESTLYNSFFVHDYDYWAYYLFARELSGHQGIMSDCESSVRYFLQHVFCDGGASCDFELAKDMINLANEHGFFKKRPTTACPIKKILDEAHAPYLHPENDKHCIEQILHCVQ